MEEKRRGIVISGVNYGENDKILNVFTLEEGMVSARIKGVKKAGAKLKFASEPFCFAEFIFSVSGDKRTVIGASLLDSFYPVREDVKKYYCSATVIEFIKRFYREEIISEDMFILAVNALKETAYGEEIAESVLVRYLISALKIAGYGLNTEGCVKCKSQDFIRVYFDYTSGAFYCEKCYDGRGREINYVTYSALKKSENGEILTGEESAYALRLLNFYVENRTEEKINALRETIKILN